LDFKITREVEDGRVVGHGHARSVEGLDTPRITIKLKRKPTNSDDWSIVDLEDMM